MVDGVDGNDNSVAMGKDMRRIRDVVVSGCLSVNCGHSRMHSERFCE